MAGKSKIEWTERTWNPVTGCDRVSAGCDHCYALTWARSLKAMGSKRYQADGDARTSGPGFGLTLHWDLVDLPRQWRLPSVVFVNSMSDLFHARVPFEFVDRIWRTMFRTPQHTYQILTKRADRMSRFSHRLPLCRNVWLGVSVEDQEHVKRVRWLDQTWADTRFISAEPLLGPVDLSAYLGDGRISWIIAGGESGPGARPCELSWLRDLRDQCQAAGVAFFCKQIGSVAGRQAGCRDAKGTDQEAWPADLRIREMPERADASSRA